jgi:hypothetical protein
MLIMNHAWWKLLLLCALWIAFSGYVIHLKRKKQGGLFTARTDREVLASPARNVVKILMEAERRSDLSPELLADMVVNYKELFATKEVPN